MHFETPWAFLLLLLIPLLVFLNLRRSRSGAIRFSSVGNAARAGASMRRRFSGLPLILRVSVLVLLVVALARPQTGREQVRELSQGIAIEMVVDRSGSMGAEMAYKGDRMTRLEVVKRVFLEFVMGNDDDLPGRPNDLVGMISFARYPDTICPLTLAHGAIPPFLESVKLVQTKSEDGTAIGDALALAAAQLKTAKETLARQREQTGGGYDIKSKVIVLLSDGENNAGRRDPLQAADLAAKWGIKVYTIAIGGSEAVTSIRTPLGVYKVPMGSRVDTDTLAAISEKTGGFFRKAEDAASLQEIYREIDKMERSQVESIRYVDYKEAFWGFALAGLLLICLEVGLTATVFRKIP